MSAMKVRIRVDHLAIFYYLCSFRYLNKFVGVYIGAHNSVPMTNAQH
jgi:hypothetical protein